MNIHIKYFASLAQMRGKEEEHIELDEPYTAQMLYDTLKHKYAFNFDAKDIRIAINHTYTDFSSKLKDKDIVVFIPPVSGG